MKLLIVCSSLDLTYPFSATPSWWQLLKGLDEIGIEVVATTYQGRPVESLWWRVLPNPVLREGNLFKAARDAIRRLVGVRGRRNRAADGESGERLGDKVVRNIARRLIAPRWRAYLDGVLRREPDFDAVLFLTIPLNHVVGVAAHIRERHRKPVLFYDGDVPASLPGFRGFSTGFRIYHGADLGEYDAFISNSKGGAGRLLEMGAKSVHVLYYGADPDVFRPVEVSARDIDVFFYGHGREYREQWIEAMIAEPARRMSGVKFAVRGTGMGDLGGVEILPYASLSGLRRYVARSKVNLCITRGAHASVYGSSTARPFELAAMGACMVSNPYLGIEEWFEPGSEVIIVGSADEAVERYKWLLSHEREREAIGRAARERFLREHTYKHRASELARIIERYL